MVFVGLCVYTKGQSGLQSDITYMNGGYNSNSNYVPVPTSGLNILRLMFTPSWRPPSTLHAAYSPALIQYFLDNSPFTIIVERNHIMPFDTVPGSKSVDFIAHLETAMDDVNAVCASFPNNPRVIVELVNEYAPWSYPAGGLPSFNSIAKQMTDHVRNAGYSNPIIMNKYESDAWTVFTTPVDLRLEPNFIVGTHLYINTDPLTEELGHLQEGLLLNFPQIINTELGAANGPTGYTQQNVSDLTTLMAWCAESNIGNCLLSVIDLQYMTSIQVGSEDPNEQDYYFWKDYFGFPSIGTVVLPYSSTFADLNNWQTINGTWSVF